MLKNNLIIETSIIGVLSVCKSYLIPRIFGFKKLFKLRIFKKKDMIFKDNVSLCLKII